MTAWTGGYEEPSFAAFHTIEEAKSRASDWSSRFTDDNDYIQILAVAIPDAGPLAVSEAGWITAVDAQRKKDGEEIIESLQAAQRVMLLASEQEEVVKALDVQIAVVSEAYGLE